MNAMQAQLKTLEYAQTNQTSSKSKYYFCSCRSNYTHGSKIWSSNKAGHQEKIYYKKKLGRSEKVCEWRLGAIINKIEIINPKVILIKLYRYPT